MPASRILLMGSISSSNLDSTPSVPEVSSSARLGLCVLAAAEARTAAKAADDVRRVEICMFGDDCVYSLLASLVSDFPWLRRVKIA